MSIRTSTIALRTIGSAPDYYLNLGAGCLARKLDAAFIGGWDELWLGFRWNFELLVDPALLPTSGGDPSVLSELYWAFGLQAGQSNSWNAGSGTIAHMMGLKAQALSTSQAKVFTSVAGNNYLSTQFQGVVVENGSQTLTSPVGDIYLPLETDIRNLCILRFVRGAPNWSLDMMRASAEAGVNTDYDYDGINTLFETITDWSSLGTELASYGYGSISIIASDAIDEGTYGALDNVFLSWNPKYLKCRCCDIFGIDKS